MPPKKPRDDGFTESPTGHHRIGPDGERVEITDQPVVSASGIHMPWQWLISGAIALLGAGVGGSSVFDRDHDDLATKAEVQKLQAETANLHDDVANLHDDIEDINEILKQIVTTKIILKEPLP